jgi:hypothetical protein
MGMFTASNFRWIRSAEDPELAGGASPGGFVRRVTAGASLLIGDYVVIVPGINRAHKTLGSSYYAGGLRTGIVVGGTKTGLTVITELGAVGQVAAVAGEDVLICVRGICYGIADATGMKAGNPISSGRTTAGRLRGDMLMSFARNPGVLQRAAVATTVAEILQSVDNLIAGAKATAAPAAGLDMAALVGTINNALWGLWEQRVASDGTTVTTAAGLLTATAKNLITLPAGSTTLSTLGFIIVHPTGTGNFVGGTTALDDGTVVPNTEYYDLVGSVTPRGYALQDGGAAGTGVLVELVGNN